MADGVVDRRVEGHADGVDPLDALAGEDVAKQRVDLLEGFRRVARFLLGAEVRRREVERVEHRQEPEAQALGGALQQLGLLAHRALAEVVEVGLQPPERVEVLVALGCHDGLVGQGLEILLGIPAGRCPSRAAGRLAGSIPRPRSWHRRGASGSASSRACGLVLIRVGLA